MGLPKPENQNPSIELRFKRWTAVAAVCFTGLLAALPFRSTPQPLANALAPSHRERSLRYRAETPDSNPLLADDSAELRSVPRSSPSAPSSAHSASAHATSAQAVSAPNAKPDLKRAGQATQAIDPDSAEQPVDTSTLESVEPTSKQAVVAAHETKAAAEHHDVTEGRGADEGAEEASGWRTLKPNSAEPSATSCRALRGENLMDIAERVLGDRRQWRDLIRLNPDQRSPFDELSEGTEILLPTSP